VDQADEQNNLKSVLELGLTLQTVLAIIAFGAKNGKEEFLKKLNDLLVEFQGSLNDDEKKELKADVDRMMDQKAEEFLTQVGLEAGEEGIDKAVEEIKKAAIQKE
jgi:hypothetical protein